MHFWRHVRQRRCGQDQEQAILPFASQAESADGEGTNLAVEGALDLFDVCLALRNLFCTIQARAARVIILHKLCFYCHLLARACAASCDEGFLLLLAQAQSQPRIQCTRVDGVRSSWEQTPRSS